MGMHEYMYVSCFWYDVAYINMTYSLLPPQNLLAEVCLFFQYAQTLFNFQTQLDSYRHFHMYIHRIALSVVLPEREINEPVKINSLLDPNFHPFPAILEESETHDSLSQPSPGFAVRGTILSQSLPRKLKHKSASTLSEDKPRPRSSLQSDHLVSKSPKAHRRGIFTKQHSIHERDDGSSVIQGSGSEVFSIVVYDAKCSRCIMFVVCPRTAKIKPTKRFWCIRNLP